LELRVDRERGDCATHEPRALGDRGDLRSASVTRQLSSIISERIQAGVSATAVQPCGASSLPCANASRMTAILASRAMHAGVLPQPRRLVSSSPAPQHGCG
jgi:hypothetical protein